VKGFTFNKGQNGVEQWLVAIFLRLILGNVPVIVAGRRSALAPESGENHGHHTHAIPRVLMTSELTMMGPTRRRRFHLTLAQTQAESLLSACNGERMADKLGIAGEQAHTLLLRLDKQQFVERIFVSERMCKLGSGMASR
jgi:hypothetical protein